MRRIKKMIHNIKEEIKSAECYAEKYIEHRADGNTNTAMRFKVMANEELEHAATMHEIAKVEIDRVSAFITPPPAMMEKWNKEHECYMQKVAEVKEILAT